jgi:hypothetical protein
MTISKSYIYELILKTNRIVDIGERRIVMATKDCGKGKPRFLIYLPMERNDLWQLLWEKRVKVKVFIEIPEEGLRKIGQDVS